MTTVNMHEAKTRFSKLVAQVEAGEEVLIARDGKVVAKLTRAEPLKRAKAGFMKGQVWMSPEFDQPDPEFESLFYDGPIFPENGNDKPHR